MKIALLASLVCGAAAFAPASNPIRTSVAMQAKSGPQSDSPLAGEIGAQPPLGFWDPLNICEDDKETFDTLRYIELKHGRVAMLAVVGYLTTLAGIRLPGYEDIPSGLKAIENLPASALLWWIGSVAVLEMTMRDATGEAEFQGDFRNGYIDFGWDKQTDAWKRNKRTIELNNGRAAQMGILGLMIHESMGNLDEILPFGTGP